MDIKIKKYNSVSDYNKLIEVIEMEGEEWFIYLSDQNRVNYQKSLKESITYVAYVDEMLCGYSRSLNDNDLYIWVIDLLVLKKFRGNSIGKKLLECIITDFPNCQIFVMSDVDDYYKKLGYKKEGSIFKISE